MLSNLGSAQIALALIVLQSRPDAMSLEEYFGRLRQCVTTEPQSIPREGRAHLDSVAFWKQAYEESEAAQTNLLDRIYELEQDQTTPRTGLASLDVPASPLPISKRKRKNEAAAKANSQSKRRNLMVTTLRPPESLTGDVLSTEKATKPEELQNGSATFMRLFFNLRQQIASKRPDERALHQALRKICHAAAILISDTPIAVLPSEPTKKTSAHVSTATNLQSTALAIQRSYPSILLGLDKLCTKTHGVRELGSIVYETVVLFETTLAKINTFAIHIAKGMAGSKLKATVRKAKSRSAKQSQSPSPQDQHASFQSLTHLTVTMLTAVDPSREPQSRILEGCLCAFLNHVGSSLSLAVFADEQSTEQREIVTGVLPPQGLQALLDIDTRTAIQAVKLEAPYLVYILEKAMAFVDGHQETMSSRSASLLSLSKEKLQNTLLRGVFGNDDETFRQALQRPAPPESGVDPGLPTQAGQAETPEWFAGEVWRILGWNILSRVDASLGDRDTQSAF